MSSIKKSILFLNKESEPVGAGESRTDGDAIAKSTTEGLSEVMDRVTLGEKMETETREPGTLSDGPAEPETPTGGSGEAGTQAGGPGNQGSAGKTTEEKGKRRTGAQKRKAQREKRRQQEDDGGTKESTPEEGASAGTPLSGKRPRETPSTGPEKALLKRSRTTTYASAAAEEGHKVAIFRDGYPKTTLTAEEAKGAKGVIREMLWELPETAVPNIKQITLFQGTLQVVCADQMSRERFLAGLTSGVRLGEETLKVAPWEDLPKLTSASVWLPTSGRTAQVLLKRLELQNQGLSAGSWYVAHCREEPKGTLLAVGIDEESVEYLRRKGNKLYFLDRLVDVKVSV